jgi:uncharacterized protein YjbI with pentapeptide repeats
MSETFENRDLSGAVFRRVNLGRALFNDVNLGEAVFDDVNLGGATIRGANLDSVTIDQANIGGMTIFGIHVEPLIEAELDRRDPERGRLRMQDPHDPESVRTVIERLEQMRDEFREMLRATASNVLVTRPTPDRWSALENVRHLVFADDLYLNHWILRNDEPLNQVGLLPDFLANEPWCANVGSQPCDDLETVLAAWDEIHAATRKFIATVTAEKLRQDTSDIDFGQGTVGGILQGMARHDLHHIRETKAVIAQVSKDQK